MASGYFQAKWKIGYITVNYDTTLEKGIQQEAVMDENFIENFSLTSESREVHPKVMQLLAYDFIWDFREENAPFGEMLLT